MSETKNYDVVVIGAGFGGLAAALHLAENGLRVALCEALTYPGGCASTLMRSGCRFEAGATLFSGFGEGQLFRGWIDRHDLDVEMEWLDPIVDFRTPGFSLKVTPRREDLIEALSALPGAPVEALRRFFELQERVASVLWPLLDEPRLLPPLGPREVWTHFTRLPRYLHLLPIVARPLSGVLEKLGLGEFEPLRAYLNGLCQITIQTGIDDAETPFALSCMDYYFRGTGHVRGGIGSLAWALLNAVKQSGGEVLLPNRVRGLRHTDGGFEVETRGGVLRSRVVVANVLPQALRALMPDANLPGRLSRLERGLQDGWGAAMLYRTIEPPEGADPGAHHLQLVSDPDAPFVEGNHVFCSISGSRDGDRAPDGRRTATVSAHIPMTKLRAMPEVEQAAYVAEVQERMRNTISDLAPEWDAVDLEMTASPRTFERFTRRSSGFVGGIPRRAGWRNYHSLGPARITRGLYLVGDSVFPGQSMLATAVGGVNVARAVLGSDV